MVNKFPAHAYTRIFYMEFVVCTAGINTLFFYNAKAYYTSGGSIFDGIAEKIQQYLVKPQLVTQYFLIKNIYRVNIQLQLFCRDVRV